MGIYQILSLVMYFVSFGFMAYAGEYMRDQEGLAGVITLILLLTAAFLAPIERDVRDPAAEERRSEWLDQVEADARKRLAELERQDQ